MTITRALGEIDPWLAAAAAAYKDDKVWWRHGFARLEDHCREVFHRSGRWLRDLAALGRAFKQEEPLEAAFAGSDGGAPLGRCRATLIARVATPLNLREWIALARRCTVEDLRKHVRVARATGSGPPSLPQEPAIPPQEPSSPLQDAPGPRQHTRLVDDEEPDTAERCRLTMQVPFPVVVAFDEGLELFRAVEGSESSVTAYIEALVGERAASGGADTQNLARAECGSGESATAGASGTGASLPGLERSPGSAPRRARGDAGKDESAALVSLPRLGDEPSALDRTAWALARFEAVRGSLASRAKADPADQIEALVHLEEDLERRLGEVLLGIGELRGWRRLGFTGAGHYAERRLGVSRSWARSWAEDRVRAARSLRRFPRLRQSYEQDAIGMEAVLRVSAVLKGAPNPDAVIDAWVERAAECTVKRLRDESRELMRRRAGLLDDFSPSGATEQREPLDDVSWFRSLARRAGTARQRVRDLAELARTRPVADTSLVLRLPNEMADDFLGALRGAQARAAAACRTFSTGPDADRGPGPAPAPDPACRTFSTGPEADREPGPAPAPDPACRTFSTGADASAGDGAPHPPPAPAWAALLVLISDFVEEWDKDDNDPKRPAHVVKTAVAFGWRCSAPGCTSRRMLQVHHPLCRSRGGGEEAGNLVLLCVFHHLRGEHGDLAACRGRAPLGVTWRLGRKPRGRHYRNETPRVAPHPARNVNGAEGARCRHQVPASVPGIRAWDRTHTPPTPQVKSSLLR